MRVGGPRRLAGPSKRRHDGSMVLEQLFENLALKVIVFATCRLADGWRLRLPCLNWVTLHYTLVGVGALRDGSGGLIPLPSNTLAVVPPGFTHAIQCGPVSHETGVEGQGDPNAPIIELVAGPLDEESLTVACGRIEASYAGAIGLFDKLKEMIVLDFRDTPHMRNIFEALISEYRQSSPGCAAMMTALMSQCLIEVLRRASQQSDGALPWLSALDDPRLSRVVETILNHPEQQYTVESLADIANMSRATFLRHFEQSFGRTPIDFVRDARLRRAARLLHISDLSVDVIAGRVGYASRSQFSHAFRELFGCSPSEFRKQPS